jgi:hypothetical protein
MIDGKVAVRYGHSSSFYVAAHAFFNPTAGRVTSLKAFLAVDLRKPGVTVRLAKRHEKSRSGVPVSS